MQPGTPEYYEFVVQQAVEGTDAELAALPNYPLIHAYMANYIVCADEAARAAYASLDSSVAQISDELSPATFCDQSDFASPNGGDCTNFVSQCLKAGGKSFTGSTSTAGRVSSTSNWYCNIITDEWHGNNRYQTWGYTTSWVNVGDFRLFWGGRAASSGYSTAIPSIISSVNVGSVVQLISSSSGQAYHSIIISEKSGSTAKYCGHSSDRYNYAFDATNMSNANGFYYYNF